MDRDPRGSPQRKPPCSHLSLRSVSRCGDLLQWPQEANTGIQKALLWTPVCSLQSPLSHSYLFVYLYVT